MSDYKTRAAHAARYLSKLGLIAPIRESEAAAALEELFDEDFIPGGKEATAAENIRPADPGMRCGVATGRDIQSGPYYCGQPATVMADVPKSITPGITGKARVCACAEHEHALRSLVKTKGVPA
jgi:hypothetical protein